MKHPLITTIAAVLLVVTAFADPIQDAAWKGDVAGIQAELDKGVNVNAKTSKGWTPLHYAAQRGQKEVANLLFTRGADANAQDERDRTPLDIADLSNHSRTVLQGAAD